VQPLLDGPRASLTEAAVKGLLQSHSSIQVTYGADGLDGSFRTIADLSAYVSAGTITSDISSTVQRTLGINIDSDATSSGWNYLSGFVKPYTTFTDMATGVSARFNLGVYTLTTPLRPLGGSPSTLQFQGYDLIYLLRQQVGDTYEVAAGSDPAAAAAQVIGLAIPEVTVLTVGSATVLPNRLTWPFNPAHPTTFLDIVQVLLGSIGYREVWVDWEGRFRIEPFIDMQQTEFEWTFDMNADDNIVAEEVTQEVDVYDVPNWWRFVMNDLIDTPVEGVSQFTWQDTSPANPGSTMNRGRLIRHIESVSVATYSDLVTYGQRVIAASMSPGETFTVKTQPFPLAWHMDTIHFLSPALAASLPSTPGGTRRVLAATWKLDITGQTDMEWTWQTITDQTAGLGLTTVTVGP
jgi:hypothetical protein